MRKSFRFIIVTTVAAMIAALAFSGGLANAQAAVAVNMWNLSGANPAQDAYWQGMADAYHKLHANVTITITNLANDPYKAKLATVMQAGDPPDLFRSWGGGVLWAFAKAGLTKDITPMLKGAWQDSFTAKAALDLYSQNGVYWGVPYDWGAVGMFYNKALFKTAGIAAPPATWTDLIADVKLLEAAKITPIVVGEKDKWPGHFWIGYLATREGGQAGFLAAYNRTGAFTDAPFVKAFTDLKQLVDLNAFQDGFLASAYGDAETIMGNGGAAMELMGQWSPGAQAGNAANKVGIGADLGWFPFPVIEGGAGKATDVFGGGDGFAVGKNAPDAAVDFLKFMTSAENQLAGATDAVGVTVPTVVKGTESSSAKDPILTSIIKARDGAPYFQLYYDQFLSPSLASAILDAAETVFAGTSSPADAAAAVEAVAVTEIGPSTAAK